MKWSNRLRERKTARWNAPLVWWVRQGEAEKKIKELKQRIKELEADGKEASIAIETIYGHAQFCDQCQSFEIAKQCRDEVHGFDRLNSLENDQD